MAVGELQVIEGEDINISHCDWRALTVSRVIGKGEKSGVKDGGGAEGS